MTARELVEILSSDDGLWLDVKVVDWAADEINNVVLKADYIRITNEVEE